MRQQAQFRVEELDCAEEVLALRRLLAGQPGVIELDFDVLRGRMVVTLDDERTSPPQIVARVAQGGMHARPWVRGMTNDGMTNDGMTLLVRHSSFRHSSFLDGCVRHRREALTIAAGVLLGLGFAVHWLASGDITAVLADQAFGTESSGVPWAARVIYLASIVAGAWFVLPRAWQALRRLRADMNLLMIVAVLGAAWLGQWSEAASVACLFSLALLLEQWSLGRARRAIEALIEVTSPTARLIPDGGEAAQAEEVPVEEVAVGNRVLVRPGEKIPLDGRVFAGTSDVNEAPITGEPLPRTKQPGDEVFAGTINGEGVLQIEVTHAAADTTLARIVHMVEEAQARRAPTQQWVETFAQYYTPAMMVAAALIAVVPPLLLGRPWTPWTPWFYQALVVLVIACPCALVISTPVSIVSALTAAMRHGVLVKGGRYLEEAARLRAVALDKTGTLTYGRPKVEQIVCFNGHTIAEVLSRAAAMEAHSQHPIARAILRRAEADGVPIAQADDYRVLPGKGAEGTFDGRPFWIGSHRFLHEKMAEEPPEVHEQALRLEDAGHTVIAVGNAQHVCGLISLADELRPGMRETLADLRRAGIEQIVMLTGDHAKTAAEVAQAAGVDAFHADLLPQDKARHVESLRGTHRHVAMIGDGVNDAPAMAAASLGIAMAAMGSDTAIETADVALMSDDLSKVPWLVRHGRRTLGIVRQNIGFALGVKAIFLALAAAGAGSLWMAIAADMGASLLVVFNGLRLLAKGSGVDSREHRA
jgi:Cd2+/Zn2+-exporting ATPase